MIEAAILVIFPFCMAHAAVSDGLTMTIANRVSILLVASFLLLAPLTGMDWSAYGMHLMAGGVVLLVTFSLFAFGAMGGGDAKLLAATALWMGWSVTLLQYLIYAALLGGMLTLALVFFRVSPLAVVAGQFPFMRHIIDDKTGIPYGIALGAAGFMMFTETALGAWAMARLVGL